MIFSNKYRQSFLLIAVLSFILSSCGGEDECAPEAWAGTWTADATCAGMPLDLTLEITAVDENTIRIESNGEMDIVDVDGCAVNVVQEIEALGMEISLDLDLLLNGNLIDVDIAATILGFTQNCTGVLTRG